MWVYLQRGEGGYILGLIYVILIKSLLELWLQMWWLINRLCIHQPAAEAASHSMFSREKKSILFKNIIDLNFHKYRNLIINKMSAIHY